ncbi:hypothetical protein [Bradyrhizobium sp. UFLA05-112]
MNVGADPLGIVCRQPLEVVFVCAIVALIIANAGLSYNLTQRTIQAILFE